MPLSRETVSVHVASTLAGTHDNPSQQETFGVSPERVLFNQQLRTQGAPSVLGVNSSGAPLARVASTHTQVNTLTPTRSSRDTQDTSSVIHDPAVLTTGAIHTAPHTVNGGENSVSREMEVPLVNDNINMGRESTELNTDLELTVNNSSDTHDLSVEEELRHDASILDDFLDHAQSSVIVQETKTETENVHVPRESQHTVDSPIDTDNVIAATAPQSNSDSMLERMMAQMAVQHAQTMSAHTALNNHVESLALSVAHTNDELASTNARVELLSASHGTTFTNRTLSRVRENDDEIEDLDDREDDGGGSVYSAIDDRRESIFPGMPSSELQKTNQPA